MAQKNFFKTKLHAEKVKRIETLQNLKPELRLKIIEKHYPLLHSLHMDKRFL